MKPLFYIACKGSGGEGAQSTFTYEWLVVFFECITEVLFITEWFVLFAINVRTKLWKILSSTRSFFVRYKINLLRFNHFIWFNIKIRSYPLILLPPIPLIPPLTPSSFLYRSQLLPIHLTSYSFFLSLFCCFTCKKEPWGLKFAPIGVLMYPLHNTSLPTIMFLLKSTTFINTKLNTKLNLSK